ncbi:DMT family transporter [Mycolicibacterium litorale]|uniref:Cation transporter n=1 Tax=Mycolicibacterium litorale TaxID=758802 RepID=A0AAD1MTR9_9MYCO|nr:multidrug efflux SMR transporter [Mycolicibacterium litorale]MCV7417463.1 multidrug efflux SMR transporter [Mycolicibacterium litorale]TDY05252.1 small multidrug resistance pump [Mycolicibacterium litorale]BBY18689.1 cation transporter [Mycolicibacterium litorale]
MTWLYLIAAIACEVAATLSLKGSETRPLLYAIVGFGYVGAFVFLTVVLKRGLGLGVAYGIWAASGVAATAVLSTVIFGEAFTVTMGIGLACIIVGVLLIETGSPRPDDAQRSLPENA